MNDIPLDELRRFVSRNEYWNDVELKREEYEQLRDIVGNHDNVYVDVREDLGDVVDVRVTIDLDQ